MTEQEWLDCTDSKPMLEFLRGKASDRKLCLFAVWCCRSIWEHMRNKSRRTVEVTERFFEGRAKQTILDAAIADATAEFEETSDNTIEHYITLAPSLVPVHDVGEADCVAYCVAKVIAHQAVYPDYSIESTEATEAAYADRVSSEQARQCRVLRCVMGNPFSPVILDPTWRTRSVLAVTRTAYEKRILHRGDLGVDRLAVLADALEDAGCTDADILGHLRGPGPHVRGCWVLDLLLNKS